MNDIRIGEINSLLASETHRVEVVDQGWGCHEVEIFRNDSDRIPATTVKINDLIRALKKEHQALKPDVYKHRLDEVSRLIIRSSGMGGILHKIRSGIGNLIFGRDALMNLKTAVKASV